MRVNWQFHPLFIMLSQSHFMEIRAEILKITGEGEHWTGWYDWSQVTVRPGSPSYNIRSVERFSCTTVSQQSSAQVVGSKHCQTRPANQPHQPELLLTWLNFNSIPYFDMTATSSYSFIMKYWKIHQGSRTVVNDIAVVDLMYFVYWYQIMIIDNDDV